MNLFLTSNIKTFCCGWFKEGIVEKNPRSLRSHWSFPAHQVFRHAGTDVIEDLKLKKKEEKKPVLPRGLDCSYGSDTGQV
jgi:hypothetical protein